MAPTSRRMKFSIYRYDPDKDQKPYMEDLEVERITSTFNARQVELRRGLCLTHCYHYANEL